jgi:hypothetical protein
MMNGQVERANDMILQGLKPRIYNDLNKFGKRWMKELPSVVWSLRTTLSRATGFTPFFLVYGAEAILPTDLEYGSPRTRAYADQSNQAGAKRGEPPLRHASRPRAEEAKPPRAWCMHLSDFQCAQHGSPGPRVMQPVRRMLRASNCTATRATATPPRLRNQYRDSRQPYAQPSSASLARWSIRPKMGRQ